MSKLNIHLRYLYDIMPSNDRETAERKGFLDIFAGSKAFGCTYERSTERLIA
jgi:hypothetical protein